MIILIGLAFLVWACGFAFLWDWTLNHINGGWGVVIPFSWLILLPCTVAQLCIWWE
jgi:hypothetical protein